jgi:hypothetical protein
MVLGDRAKKCESAQSGTRHRCRFQSGMGQYNRNYTLNTAYSSNYFRYGTKGALGRNCIQRNQRREAEINDALKQEAIATRLRLKTCTELRALRLARNAK